MALSSNSVIHLTTKMECLKGILADNFHVKYCSEHICLDAGEMNLEVPMVSFCDIPLSEIKSHIEKYGSYGIGLTKDWARRKALNPVLYVEPMSYLATSLREVYDKIVKKYNPEDEGQRYTTMAAVDVLRYVKKYEGTLERKSGEVLRKYRFSDEREWRYVPCIEDFGDVVLHDKLPEETVRAAHEKLRNLRLEFEPTDITYLIINTDDEIREILDYLRDARDARGRKCTRHDVERLMTRILTVDQIKNDF